MISELKISNYKSLHDVTLDVGRFNVLIGENGCGKSNLLEAITFAAAAEANKLDKEFLTSRGIRVTEPKLMRSAFDDEHLKEPIKVCIVFKDSDILEKYTLENDNQPYSKWVHTERLEILEYLKNIVFEENGKLHTINVWEDSLTHIRDDGTSGFVIYSPENTALRNFYKEGQIEPLGINGEGLFKLLKVIQNKSAEQWKEIQDCLQLFDWYDGFKIPKDSQFEDKITITDHYLTMDFDQRSANEGFLFVLFYIALMVSDDTPKIFAIDNIDTSLNPKLCTKIIKELIRLATKYGKQVFVTTHNPAILDGIDLGDEEQRLFVVSRNKTGHTRFKRITLDDKPKSSTNEELRLSEAFLRGYLGGLPKGF